MQIAYRTVYLCMLVSLSAACCCQIKKIPFSTDESKSCYCSRTSQKRMKWQSGTSREKQNWISKAEKNLSWIYRHMIALSLCNILRRMEILLLRVFTKFSYALYRSNSSRRKWWRRRRRSDWWLNRFCIVKCSLYHSSSSSSSGERSLEWMLASGNEWYSKYALFK